MNGPVEWQQAVGIALIFGAALLIWLVIRTSR